MSDIDDGGPAFPFPPGEIHQPMRFDGNGWIAASSMHYQGSNGMSLRDYFAAGALSGILAAKFSAMVAGVPESCRYDLAATDAYAIADAMLKVRKQ